MQSRTHVVAFCCCAAASLAFEEKQEGSASVLDDGQDGSDGSEGGFMPAFLQSIAMIIVSEIGDKTFFIAAIMAMRHPRCLVFAGAISALALMTVLSAALGHAAPRLLPAEITHYIATALFLIFGVRSLKDAYSMTEEEQGSELEEVEAELGKKEEDVGEPLSEVPDIESQSSKEKEKKKGGGRLLHPIFLQCFSLTFLAEWGDRSQIATIALAAQLDAIGVTLGGVLGHAFCTGMAVIGGRLLATRISERSVLIAGGVLFLVFGVLSLMSGPEITRVAAQQ